MSLVKASTRSRISHDIDLSTQRRDRKLRREYGSLLEYKPCRLVNCYRCFEDSQCLQLQGSPRRVAAGLEDGVGTNPIFQTCIIFPDLREHILFLDSLSMNLKAQ